MDAIEKKSILEAGDPAEYARAQEQMARLEKAAKYTGDDPIVRSRMGLPPKLPPIAQWDGKMPAPVGKPDWFSRLTTMGGSTDAQAQAVAVNQADNATDAEYKASITKAKDLIAKIKAALGTPAAPAAAPTTAESLNFKSYIARQLTESFGYKLAEGVEEAKPLMAELGKIVQGFGSTEDPEMLGIAQQYSELQNTMNKPAAAPASGPSAQDLTGAASASGEAVGKKLQRLKDLLAKAKGAKATTTAAAPTAAPGQSATPNPLAQDNATADIKKIVARESLAESIARMRNKLALIESEASNEGLADLAKGAWNVGKNFVGGLGGKTAVGLPQTAATMPGKSAAQIANAFPQAASSTAKTANKVGTAIAKNPIRTAVGATAAGAGLAYGLSGKPEEKKPEDNKPPVVPPKKPGEAPTPRPTPTTSSNLTPEEDKELDMLAREFGDSEDPEIADLMKQYGEVKNAMLNQK
jgi:hypothetical protein